MKTELDNLRVVTLALNVPGPVAASRLAGMGARVVKVEPPGGDPLGRYSAEWYKALNAGQEIVLLNLKEAAGLKGCNELLASADVLLTAQRPSALHRLSLDWPRLHRDFPRLCHVAIVGHARPNEEMAGHDLTYVAGLGLVCPPGMPLTLLADLGGAEMAVSAALRLLLVREQTGEGAYMEVALAEAAEQFARPLMYGVTRPGGLLGGGFAGYGLYETRAGYLAVSTLEGHFFSRLLKELELAAGTRQALEQAFSTRTAAEWEVWARERDLPICMVRTWPVGDCAEPG
ncbi:MAG: CoA transferase [Candidatus Hydrogenedentes bacterium]|nr:CoA transferase [Candidatus Hydrogenedentota bacterium]